MSTCSIKLDREKLPKIISKLEFFMFRALEKEGRSFFSLTDGNKSATIRSLLNTVKTNIIPEYINEYLGQAAAFRNVNNEEQAEIYEEFATNLSELLTLWDQIVPNFVYYSGVFSVKNKLNLDTDGLVDTSEIQDDETKLFEMMEFDKASNEIDPLDQVDQVVELFLRSIVDENNSDDYGFTVGVNYPQLIQTMFSDLENAVSLEEIIRRLEAKIPTEPVYRKIVETLRNDLTSDPNINTMFRIRFRNTFSKAFVPIYMVSVENTGGPNTIKVFEAAAGRRSMYEQIIASNFMLRGMPVMLNGAPVNMAVKKDGIWVLDKTSIPKLKEYIQKSPQSELVGRQIEVLKGIGFQFEPATEQALRKSGYFGPGAHKKFAYIFNHLISLLEYKDFVSNPYKDLKSTTVFDYNTQRTVSHTQSSSLFEIIKYELKNNPLYNVERSVLNAEGNRQHTIQLHNNFTIINKMLSDYNTYPTLHSILQSEPSAYWMDPEQNVTIRNSMIMNSLFYMDPTSPDYGKRKRVTKDASGKEVFSPDSGEYVQVTILNTGGLQSKRGQGFGAETESASSTALSDIEKILQDINSFKAAGFGYNSVLRLGDKSTDLGISMNYYEDPVTKLPINRPLASIDKDTNDIFSTAAFNQYINGALLDLMQLKYLNKNGFLKELKAAKKNISGYSYFDKILSKATQKKLDQVVEAAGSIDDIELLMEDLKADIKKDTVEYFNKYALAFINKFKPTLGLTRAVNLIGGKGGAGHFENTVKYYLANSFITDLEQMKIFFGDAIFFKDFHKRASKDSATGTFAIMDEMTLDALNVSDMDPYGNTYADSTNMGAHNLISRLLEQGLITTEQAMSARAELTVKKSYKSATLKDVNFQSKHAERIDKNVQKLIEKGLIPERLVKLYNRSLKSIIQKKYNGTEADGQGKCTFDFYRIISIATNQWSDQQESVYRKITRYDHYDRLADATTDETKKAEYITLRDSVGYNPLEPVYFPPKKFQYAGTMKYQKTIQGENYGMYVPVFDKFSLQPLIPTIIKNTPDDELNNRMLFNGVGYVKYESGTKVETIAEMDTLYENYDENKPDERTVLQFNPSQTFKSQHTLYFNHLKEQVTIDAAIHEDSVFGSQIRKLIMMNIDSPQMAVLYDRYKDVMKEMVELEKTALYNDLGLERKDGKIQIKDLNKLVEYFFAEIDKKNQDNNVRRALKYDDVTGKFEIPLDGAVQAQILEGIIISAINNRVVRYKTNGSMLVQVAITGTERIHLSKTNSETALKTFGNEDLAYYDIVEEDGKTKVKAMEVKIGLTGQWLKLLELTHPDGQKIGSLERLNDALKNEAWRKQNRKSIRMIAYRIPTQGRNFSDVMEVKEFLPAAFGDAIIMPSEVVIKSGSDFDIDKMFVFYPNLDKEGKYVQYDYSSDMLYADLEQMKDKAVNNLKIIKNYRAMTLDRMYDDLKKLKKAYLKNLRLDTKNRSALTDLIRQVRIGLALIEAEDAEIRKEMTRVAERNEKDNSWMDVLIKNSVMYTEQEYRSWIKENGINVMNPSLWIDTKRRGLEELLNALVELDNRNADKKTSFDTQKEEIDLMKADINRELEAVRKNLYRITNMKGNVQNKMYDIMAETILDPVNYIELVTPSDNFLIMPIVDEIYRLLGKGVDSDGKHLKTDFKNTDILNRWVNAQKYMSLLKGKRDLGIAAVANTFNVLYQISKAKGNAAFFKRKRLKSQFRTPDMSVNEKTGFIYNIDYSNVYDEDGNLKSEFFSEFINSFVDAAKDDYVFAINVVTELAPIVFYMKYTGLATDKILYFINQPAIRSYIRYMMEYDNKFVKTGSPDPINIRQAALKKVVSELGFDISFEDNITGDTIEPSITYKNLESQVDNFSSMFTADALKSKVALNNMSLKDLSSKDKAHQFAVLTELLAMKEQSSSMTELQKALNFDTKTYASGFDIYARGQVYTQGVNGGHVLSPETIQAIRKESMIAPLNVGKDIAYMLDSLLPIRNNLSFNSRLLTMTSMLRSNFENKVITTGDDELMVARTAKNDIMQFIFQRLFDKSAAGNQYFKEYFNTDKSVNDYLGGLITTTKMVDSLNMIKALPDYNELVKAFPIINNLVAEQGENNNRIYNFKILQNSSNTVDKNAMAFQFEKLTNLTDPDDPGNADFALVRNFFRDLALYSMFQSGMNKSDISYTDLVPVEIVNKLYGFAAEQFNGLSEEEKSNMYDEFITAFKRNNPMFFGQNFTATPIRDISKRGKWYAQTPLDFKTGANKTRVVIVEGTTNTKQAARNNEGIYSMRPNPGDNIPGVNEHFHFGNPWSHAGYQGTIKTGSLSEAEAKAAGSWKGDVKSTAVSEAAENYGKWLRKEDFLDVEPRRREWILDQIETGRLVGKPLLYFKPGYRSHADILAEFINDYDPTQNPLIAAGVKPKDMAGNAAKDIIMARRATQFIGFQSGTASVSSTDKYRKAWGDKANTGEYTKEDVVMVSGSGLFRGVTEQQITTTLRTKYKPLLEKAIAAGVTFVIGNQYEKGNLSDKRVADYLIKKGYRETKYKGWSEFTPPVLGIESISPVTSDIRTALEKFGITTNLTDREIYGMYDKESLSNETMEEFLQRMSCLGKL